MMFNRLSRPVALIALLAFGSALQAAPIFINFENDALGAKPNGFTSADSALVHFTDSQGAGLVVSQLFSECNNTRCLETQPDDGGFLIMDFDVLMNVIAFDFGNDQPFGSNNVQDAVLTVFRNNVQVGQSVVQVNNNDLMDQNIAFAGAQFDQATFLYRGANGQPATLIEVIDNIRLNSVPEAATLSLMSLGVIGLGLRRRRS